MRSELKRELHQRLTDLFWKLSSDVIKSLIRHKADVTSHDLPPQHSASQKRLSLAEVGRGRSSLDDSL